MNRPAARSLIAGMMLATAVWTAIGGATGPPGQPTCPGIGSSVSTTILLKDCRLELTQSLTVGPGGVLRLQNATLHFDAPEIMDFSLDAGATLEIETGQIDVGKNASLRIRFNPGSIIRIRNAVLDGYDSLSVGSRTCLLDHVVARGPIALHLQDGAEVRLLNSTLDAAQTAVVAESNATIHMEGTSWTGGITLAANARLERAWFVRVRASAEEQAPMVITLQDASGKIRIDSTLDVLESFGNAWAAQTPWTLVPVERRAGATTEEFGPYRIIGTQGRSAAHQELTVASNADVEIHVAPDVDDAPPAWPEPQITQETARPGYSNDGRTSLGWRAADDSLGGEKPNRGIFEYVIHVDDIEVARTRLSHVKIDRLAQGMRAIRIEAIDFTGQSTTAGPLAILVDTAPPAVAVETTSVQSSIGGYNGTATIRLQAEDAGASASGMLQLRWRIADGITHFVPAPYEAEIVLENEGNHSLQVIAEDRAGNRAETRSHVTIDRSPPLFLARLEPAVGEGAWHRGPATLHIDVLDPGPSGPGGVAWRTSQGPWSNYAGPTAIELPPGEHALQVRVTDGAANHARTQLRFAHDPQPPTLTTHVKGPQGAPDWFVGPATIQASAADALSGVGRLEIRVASGAWRPFEKTVTLQSSGVHALGLRATDRAGNEIHQNLTVRIDQEAPLTPRVVWTAFPDGRVGARWSDLTALDLESGVSQIWIENRKTNESDIERYVVDPGAAGHVLVGLASGEYPLRVLVKDAAGHEAATPWTTLHASGSPLETSTPLRARGTVTLRPNPSVAAEDLAEVQYYVDGVLESSTATAPFTFEWKTRQAANGIHDVRIVAADTQGLSYEERQQYEVRNGYPAAILDDPLPVAAVLLAGGIGLALAIVGYTRWRRWVE